MFNCFHKLIALFMVCVFVSAAPPKQQKEKRFDVESLLTNNVYKGPEVPTCSTPEPCDMAIGTITNGVVSPVTTEEAICACPSPKTCPSGWTNETDQSLKLRLKSRNHNLVVQFHYCDNILDVPDCQGDELALKVESSIGLFPQKIQEMRCKCSGNQPMVLQRTRVIAHRLVEHQEFVCELPTCVHDNGEALCMHSQMVRMGRRFSFINTHICMCGEGYRCSINAQRSSGRGISLGFCEQRS